MLAKEMLTLPSFADSTVIAGEDHLDNEIESAMILEGPDIQNWGRRNQLIISSFYALEDLDESGLGRFFRTMGTIGIGAFAFKPGRAVEEVPRAIIELCEDFDLPLIRLSPQVKYEAILSDVLGHVLDSNLTLLNRFYESHRHVMALALKQPSVSYILNTLKNSLHADTTYLDTTRDRRIGTDVARADFTAYSFTRRDPSRYQTHAYFDARLYYGVDGGSPSNDALAIRIPSSDGIDYYLIIHSAGESLTPVDTMLVENIVSLLQIEILKQNAIEQKLFYQNNNTVHDLLLGRFPSRERIDAALSLLGIDRYPNYQALLVRSKLVDPADTDRQDELHQAIRRRLRTAYPGIVWYVNGDRLIILHNFRSDLTGIGVDEVQRMLDELHNSSTLPLFDHLAVLSSTAERYDLPTINNEVINAYRLFDDSSYRNVTLRFDSLGIYKLLLSANDLSQLEGLIDPRVRRLRAEQPDLFRTIATLCGNGMNYAAAAEALFLHPKTVRYRAERVRELYGLDTRTSDDFIQVVLADKIFALKREG